MRTITNDEVLFTYKLNLGGDIKSLSLCKQSYSDDTCFYTLQDARGNWKVEYGDHDIKNLIKQLEHEIKIDSEQKELDFIKNNPAILQVINDLEEWRMKIINHMKLLTEGGF